MTAINNYLIEPLAPLVFRSGKPFGSHASATDVIFPLPSAAAGLIRATSIHQQQELFDEHLTSDHKDHDYQQLLSIKSVGPFLARFDEALQHIDILVPKPADALYFEDKADNNENNDTEANIQLIRLAPKALDNDCGSDLPDGLLPVQMEKSIEGKPKSGVSYWTLEHLKQWQSGVKLDFETLQRDGITHLPVDLRTHVAIDQQSKSSKSGQLFQTASFDLNYPTVENKTIKGKSAWQNSRLGFVVQSQQQLSDDTVTFGGERRLSKFLPIQALDKFYDDSAEGLLDKINTAQGFRLTFLTPCIFANGYLPTWLNQATKKGILPHTQATVSLKACAIDKWQPISGWDSIVWKPKAMRKAVSSGSVYWFTLDSQLSLTELEQLMMCIWSDHPQDKNDGFGSALISPWSEQ